MIQVADLHISYMTMAAACVILLGLFSILWWMQHPPATKAALVAKEAERQLKEQLGTSIVVFSSDIRSEHMMVLASRLARGQRAQLLAAYIIEVPFTLPTNAEMQEEDRGALDILAAAEVIAKNQRCEVRTEIIHHRQTSQAVLELAKREKAQLIIMGSYREGRYTGAPLSRTIESIAANAKCDVLIGVEGKHGTLLADEPIAAQGGTPRP
ncbi:MAG: universal stress protein [Candidatus Baltobacteraceae bacterium]